MILDFPRAGAVLAALLFSFNSAVGEPMDVHYFGNSLTDELKYKAFEEMAATAGHEINWDRQMAPGVPVYHHWKRHAQWGEKFNQTDWDVVTLQPFQNFEREFRACQNFAEYLHANQPDVQLYIYAQWPHRGNPNWEAAFTTADELAPDGKHDWTANSRRETGEAYWLENVAADAREAGYDAKPERSLKNEYELIVQGVNARVDLEKPAKLIPAGHVFELLATKMRAGQVPGYSRVYDLYSDGVHVNNVGSYIVACTFYATLFGESPVGLPVGGYQGEPRLRDDRYPISEDLARVIQETVWEVVATHPLTGVKTDLPVKVASASLPRFTVGEPAQAQLLAAFGEAPYRWRVSQGGLPEGLTLEENGALSGTVTANPGEYAVEIEVRDARGQTSRKAFDVRVDPDRAPAIVTAPELPARRVGEYFQLPLRHEGGNGAVRWTAGRDNRNLPPGLTLTPEGLLSGAPAAEGAFTFEITARDEDLGTAETAKQPFQLTVTPPGPDVIRVRKVDDGAFQFDGRPDESFWEYSHAIEKVVAGERGDLRGAFDIVVHQGKLVVAVWVKDAGLFPNRETQDDGDSIEIFLDTLNNREDTYNYDDRRVVLVPTEKWHSPITVAPSGFGIGRKWTKVDGGYAAEFSFLLFALGIKSQSLPRVVGFDVAINDDDDGKGRQSQIVWKGTADNATRPDAFGTLILSE